jgi:hypothetical protein
MRKKEKAAMEVIRLPHGEAAPVDSDCIGIDEAGERFRLTGSLLAGEESRAIIDGPTYESYGAAEAAGIAWAEDQGVATLYVGRDSPGPVPE